MKRALAALLCVYLLAGAIPPAAAANISRLDAAVPEIGGLVMTLTDVLPYYSRGAFPLEPAQTVCTLYFGPEGTVRFSRSVEMTVFDAKTLAQSVVRIEADAAVPVSAISGGRLSFDDPAAGFVCFVSMGDPLRAAGAAAADLDVTGLDAHSAPPPDAERVTAVPSPQKVFVDGGEIAISAYNIGGYNYFKLRDVAFALRETDKTFEVLWNEKTGAIEILRGRPYTPDGSEMRPSGGAAETAVTSPAAVSIDGVRVSLKAYNIRGNTYFRLRDLGAAIGFNVDYGEAENAVFIDTGAAG